MIVKSFDICKEDYESAKAWLDKRQLDIDGDPNAVNFKDRIIASVAGMTTTPKTKKKKGEK